MHEEREHLVESLPEPEDSCREPSEGQTHPRTKSWVASPWLWIGLAVGAFSLMGLLCFGVATIFIISGARSENRSAYPSAQTHATPWEPTTSYAPNDFSGGSGTPIAPYGSDYPNVSVDSYPSLSDSGDSFSDSLRESDAERSWWSEEWSRALGDNYPEPTHVDPDGNPGWVDHSGAFHDYNSGMSDYESSTLSGAGTGE